MLKLYALLSAHSHLHHCVHVTLTYCCAVKLFWYYCSRIAPIARIFFRNVLYHHRDDGFYGFREHCMLTLLLARCCG